MVKQLSPYNLKHVVCILFKKKIFILSVVSIFIIFGICTFSWMKKPPIYTAQCTMLVLFNNINNTQGVMVQNSTDFGLSKKENILPLKLYPKITQSISFLIQLTGTPLSSDSTLLHSTKLGNIISIKNNFNVSVDESNQTVCIEASMGTPTEAARLAQKVQETLSNYLIQWYSCQQQQTILLLQKNINETINKIIQKKQELYKLITSKSTNNSAPNPDLIKLETEHQTLITLNTALTKQLQQKELEQQNLATYITTIDPVIIPNSPSNPSRSIMFYLTVFGLLGLIVSTYIIIIHPIINFWVDKND